jgi:agmatinase
MEPAEAPWEKPRHMSPASQNTSTPVPPAPRYGPVDAFQAPRYTGIKTFARCPNVSEPDGVDVAVVGVPFDTATSFRAGARFGPEAIRAGSALLRPYHPTLDVDVFAGQSVVDWGDVAVTPGNGERTTVQIADELGGIVGAGVVPITLGGDHSIVLGVLRAQAAVHGPVGLVLLDAHADTWEQYYGETFFHGTVFKRAVEEGLIAPERSVLAGMRGSLYGPEDLAVPRSMGFEVIPGDALRELSAAEFGRLVRDRLGDAPPYLSFDIDVIDPAYAPGTGTPEVGGLSGPDALGFVRALAGIDFRGFDVVEVSPPYDSAGQVTALIAANVAYEFLALRAIAARNAQPA